MATHFDQRTHNSRHYKENSRKAAALVKPVVDIEGIEEVDLSGDE